MRPHIVGCLLLPSALASSPRHPQQPETLAGKRKTKYTGASKRALMRIFRRKELFNLNKIFPPWSKKQSLPSVPTEDSYDLLVQSRKNIVEPVLYFLWASDLILWKKQKSYFFLWYNILGFPFSDSEKEQMRILRSSVFSNGEEQEQDLCLHLYHFSIN